ncbi:MAG TPA: class A beta-lactamase-related serine hydrolase [Thiolapillus brandeum]|uniref:Class A beta-lactamase-related serine hydrolase n=1 Tax=Thiolapillus brandeum TaxID=1076588 RepID=A0A831RR78_9GAMM|nr:class A beta-lactamase-related serine hydrolase [Thiolapillus brandeum]
MQRILDHKLAQGKFSGAAFCMELRGQMRCASSGNLDSVQSFFIASTTKLYTTTLVLKMRAEGQLELDDPIGLYLEPNITQGLHEYRGTSHGARITIRQLLAHRSGLPDYFRDRTSQGDSYERRLIEQGDFSWTFEQAIRRSKQLSPRFTPGTAGKAYYSDTNYQLLGRILEVVSGLPYAKLLKRRIFHPLRLENSYLFTDPTDQRPAAMQYRNRTLWLPQAMASFGPDGGIVSTASELAVFGRAFFGGDLFPAEYLSELYDWEDIFSPLQSGTGIHRIRLPWYLTWLLKPPELYGHSGLSGALLFWSPKRDIIIAGTVNRIDQPDLSYRTLYAILNSK